MSKNKKIFLDTSALIPLLTSSHPNHSIVKRHLGDFSHFYIDSTVLAEFLAGIEPSMHWDCTKKLGQQFQIGTLSPEGSAIMAKIYQICKRKGIVPKSRTEHQVIKVDMFILASAIESKVNTFLFADGDFTLIQSAIANEELGYSLPEFTKVSEIQKELFDEISC